VEDEGGDEGFVGEVDFVRRRRRSSRMRGGVENLRAGAVQGGVCLWISC
jgi:hypothetical protein